MDIKLKKKRGTPDLYEHYLFVQTDKSSYMIGFDENYVNVAGEQFYTIDPGYNPIYSYIIDQDFDWEIEPLIPTE